MLGKLIKNDIKSGFYTVINVYIAALAAIAFMLFGILAKSEMVKALSSLALIVVMIVVVVFTFFAVILMFSKSVYGNVGYLTLSLPVKEWELVLSKTLTGVLFILISYITFIVSTAALFFYMSGQTGAAMALEFWQQAETLGLPSKDTLLLFFLVKSILGLVSIFFIVAVLHISASLINVSGIDKFGTAGSIVIFVVITGVLRGISERIGALVNFYMVIKGKEVFFTFSNSFVIAQKDLGALSFELSQYLVLLLFSAALSAGAVFLIKKKINLK